jgi:hypothetical protein
MKFMTKLACDCLEYPDCFGGYFGTNPVTGQRDHFDFHNVLIPPRGNEFIRYFIL